MSDFADIGTVLIERGWCQGGLVDAAEMPLSALDRRDTKPPAPGIDPPNDTGSSRAWYVRSGRLAPDECFVVASQDCDLVRSVEHEPYVEMIRAYWTTDRGEMNEARKGNSFRRFLLQERQGEDGRREGLIADATVRVLVHKAALLDFPPRSAFAAGAAVTPPQFAKWLARRYDRPAIDTPYVRAIQGPIVAALERLKASDWRHDVLDSLGEILLYVRNEAEPFEVELLLLRKETAAGPEPVDEERVTELIGWVAEILDQHGKAKLVDWEIYDLASISVRDYIRATPLPLDHVSLPEDRVPRSRYPAGY